MPNLNHDALGAEAKELVLEIEKLQQASEFYPQSGLKQDRVNIFKKLNTLSQSAPKNFKALLDADDLFKPRDKFFFDYMTDNPQSEALYLEMCNSADLVSYVLTMCEGMIGLFNISNSNPTQSLAIIKTKIISFSEILQKNKFARQEADPARIAIIKKLAHVYRQFTSLTKDDRAFLAAHFKSQIENLDNVNSKNKLLDLISMIGVWNENLELQKNLFYILIKKGLNPTSGEDSQHLNLARINICNYDPSQNYDFFKYALSINSISTVVLNNGLKQVHDNHNLGAMRAIFEALVARGETPYKFQFIEVLQQNCCTREADTRRLVAYLELCKSSVNEMLEHIAVDPTKLFKAIKSMCFVSDYFLYEKGNVQGIFYYLAKHHDLSAKIADGSELIPFYINPRYNLNARNTYCEDEMYIVGGHSITELFVKKDPELSPVDIAVVNNNVQFMLFVLKVIAAPVATNTAFRSKISAAILKLMDQGQDVSCIREFLTKRCNEAWRPGRWFSFEYGLRSEIDKKTLALTKPTQNTPMFKAHVAKQKQSEVSEPAKSSSRFNLQIS